MNSDHDEQEHDDIDRREFWRRSAGFAAAASAAAGTAATAPESAAQDAVLPPLQIDFSGRDSLVHPQHWESLNPGYWKIEGGALRRRLRNVGDRARATGFPFHAMSKGGVMSTEYDPSLPSGILYRRDRRAAGPFTVTAEFTYRGDRTQPAQGDDPQWSMYRDGYGRMGIAIGAKSLFESHKRVRHAVQAVWCDDATMRLIGGDR